MTVPVPLHLPKSNYCHIPVSTSTSSPDKSSLDLSRETNSSPSLGCECLGSHSPVNLQVADSREVTNLSHCALVWEAFPLFLQGGCDRGVRKYSGRVLGTFNIKQLARSVLTAQTRPPRGHQWTIGDSHCFLTICMSLATIIHQVGLFGEPMPAVCKLCVSTEFHLTVVVSTCLINSCAKPGLLKSRSHLAAWFLGACPVV